MATGQAKIDWDKANAVMCSVKLNKKKDEKIIEKLSKVDSKQGYIKQLIREDLKKEEQK